MDEDPSRNLNPRPLLECLDTQLKHQKRKKNRTFQRNDSSKKKLIKKKQISVFISAEY